jgi:hypothetical protein
MLLKKRPSSYLMASGKKPDTYEYSDSGLLPRPSTDFVISRNILGEVVSRYSDDIHDFEAYNHTRESSYIDYRGISIKSLREDAKFLMFIYERFVGHRSRNGNTLSLSVMSSVFRNFVLPMANFANANNLMYLKELFENESLLTKFIHKSIQHGAKAFRDRGETFFNDLIAIGKDKLGFTIGLSNSVNKKLIKLRAENKDRVKEQTSVIPPRIYLNFIYQLWEAVDEFENIQKPFIKMITVMAAWPSNTAVKDNDGVTNIERKEQLEPFLKIPIIKKMLDKYDWACKSTGISKRAISLYISDFQKVCKWLIHLYSGMRSNEARCLPFHCLSKEESKGRPAARLLGYTYKYAGNALKGDWVTTFELERVIQSLQAINKVLTTYWPISTAKKTAKAAIRCPLFLSITHFVAKNPTAKKAINKHNACILNGGGVSINTLIDWSPLVITEQDIEFLERLEPEREWRGGLYDVGNAWPMRSHQCRRSLVIYSRQSGLVSIGSTQTQLHHLFRETSYYYSNNSENCTFDVTDENHFAKEYAKESPTADYGAFITNILYSDEPLYGMKGKDHEAMRKGTNDKCAWVMENRKSMEKKFKNGEISHRDTAIGSCGSIDACDQFLTYSFTECIKCTDATMKKSKIDRTLERQTIFVQSLEPDSIEYRYESSELEQLKSFRDTM